MKVKIAFGKEKVRHLEEKGQSVICIETIPNFRWYYETFKYLSVRYSMSKLYDNISDYYFTYVNYWTVRRYFDSYIFHF